MAGVRMRVEAVGLGQLREELAGFAARGGDLTPAMRSIGEALLTETRERFRAGKDPRGQPWAPLSEATKRKKKRNKEKILIYRGHLLGTLAIGQVTGKSVEIGSTRIYGGTHQFGAAKGSFGAPIPWGDIPARPFLGLSRQSTASIARIIARHIEG